MFEVTHEAAVCYPPQFSLFNGGIQNVIATDTLSISHLHKLLLYHRGLRRRTKVLRALPLTSEARKACKLRLPYVTPAGIFEQRRTGSLVARSGLLVLDFDHVPDLNKLKKVLRYDKVFGASLVLYFVSPSGDGLKVFVAVDCRVEHKVSFEAIKIYLQARHPHWFQYLDLGTNDVARACFLAHDPEAYLNPNWDYPTPFPVDGLASRSNSASSSQAGIIDISNITKDISQAEAWVAGVEVAGGFPDGYTAWFETACSLATLGEVGRSFFHRVSKMSPKYSPTKCDKQFDVVLRRTRNRFSLGTFIYHCQQAGITPIIPDAKAGLAGIPLFPASTYPLLPDYLRRCCAPFVGTERDVMLLGTLAVLSGCFTGVGGTYHRRSTGLNLYIFIAGPPASGKSGLVWARSLAEPWHEQLVAAGEVYQKQLAAYNKSDEQAAASPPDQPAYQQLYIPGNVTAAASVACLAENRGCGIICETEADTLSGALGTDFGNFSDVLRKAFHGESISLMRKTNREHLQVKRPVLSVALTGTANQLLRLLPSAEDGLVSRFLLYTIEQDFTWQEVGVAAGPALDPYMKVLAEELSKMLAAMPVPEVMGEFPVQITLAATDWQRLNEACAAGLDEALAANGGLGASTAFRLGLIAWRIVGILTVLRCFERQEVPNGTLEAATDDVTIALSLMEVARAHAMMILQNLTKPAAFKASKQSTKAEKLEKVVALNAKGLSLRQIEQQTGVPFNTVARWLKELQ